jgi:hypothetical protein
MATEATEIINLITDNCPRDLEVIKNTLAIKTHDDTLKDMINNHLIHHSYYAAPLTNDVLPIEDIIVGFVATAPTTFTFFISKEVVEQKYASDDLTIEMIQSGDYDMKKYYNDDYTRKICVGETITKTNSSNEDCILTKSLNEGEFQLALGDNIYPVISNRFNNISISNLNGSGFIIYANVDTKERRILAQSTFNLGNYRFHGMELFTNT